MGVCNTAPMGAVAWDQSHLAEDAWLAKLPANIYVTLQPCRDEAQIICIPVLWPCGHHRRCFDNDSSKQTMLTAIRTALPHMLLCSHKWSSAMSMCLLECCVLKSCPTFLHATKGRQLTVSSSKQRFHDYSAGCYAEEHGKAGKHVIMVAGLSCSIIW